MSLTFNTGFKIGSKAITLQFENDFPDLIIADQCTYVRWKNIFVCVNYCPLSHIMDYTSYSTYLDLIGNYCLTLYAELSF